MTEWKFHQADHRKALRALAAGAASEGLLLEYDGVYYRPDSFREKYLESKHLPNPEFVALVDLEYFRQKMEGKKEAAEEALENLERHVCRIGEDEDAEG